MFHDLEHEGMTHSKTLSMMFKFSFRHHHDFQLVETCRHHFQTWRKLPWTKIIISFQTPFSNFKTPFPNLKKTLDKNNDTVFSFLSQAWGRTPNLLTGLSGWWAPRADSDPPAPMNYVPIFMGCLPKCPFRSNTAVVQNISNHCHLDGRLEMKTPTTLSNKTSTTWSCAEDQILENKISSSRFWIFVLNDN